MKDVVAIQPGGSMMLAAYLGVTDHCITVEIVIAWVGVSCPVQQFNTVNLLWVGIGLEGELTGNTEPW